MWRRVPLCRLPARRPWPGFMYLSPEWAGLHCKVGAMTRTPSGGRARPCDAHSAPGCSVTCPRHRARRAGSTRTDQSFIYKKKKLKPVLNSSRSCSGPSRDENPVFGSHRIPQDRRVPLPVLCSQGTAPASQLSVLTRHGRRSFLERLVQTSGPVAPCLGLPGLRGRFGQKVGHAVLC